jgi:rod shape determining protein RodA
MRLWRQLAIATNWPILAAIAVLSSAGVLSIYYSKPDLGIRQLIYMALAVACMAGVQAINYAIIGRYAWPFYFGSLGLVLYTVVGAHVPLPGVNSVNGASAWINLGFMSLEPSELMKISFVMVLARYLRFRSTYRTLPGLLPPFALALVPVVLILMQPDLGVAALFFPDETHRAHIGIGGGAGADLLVQPAGA